MKKYLTSEERNDILNKILEHAKNNSIKGYHYCYAFGYISVILTDEQLKDLERGI